MNIVPRGYDHRCGGIGQVLVGDGCCKLITGDLASLDPGRTRQEFWSTFRLSPDKIMCQPLYAYEAGSELQHLLHDDNVSPFDDAKGPERKRCNQINRWTSRRPKELASPSPSSLRQPETMQSILGGLGRNQNVLGKKARLLSAYLTYYDTIFLVDDSATVKQNEWKEIQESLLGLCEEAAKFDENGISVQFFNDPTKLRNTKNVHDVKNAFSKVKPMGTANVGKKLKELMDEHNSASGAAQKISQKALYDVKPLSIVVLTDGEFTEEPHEIISQIRRALQVTKTIHSPQDINRRIGIQFVQVGQDSAARDALNGLDNALPAEEDMIDTVRWNKGLNTETLYKILLGSIYDTIDQHGDTRAVGQQQQQHAGGYQSGGQQQQQPSGHQAGGMSSKPPGMSDTNKPIDGLNCNGGDYHQPLARHEYAIRIPARHKATVTAQANAQLPQRVNLFLHPQRDGFPLFFEGKGEKQVMEVRHVGNKVRIDATSQDTWMVISTEFGLPCGRMTKWVAAPNKRISQNGSNFVIGSDDGGVTMNPDGDYNDALVTVTVQAE